MLKTSTSNKLVSTHNTISLPSIHVLHECLGHCSVSKLKHVPITKDFMHSVDSLFFDSCVLAKQTKLPLIRSDSLACKPFDLLYLDIWDPYKVPTHAGNPIF